MQVSVLMPAFNAGRYIAEAMESVLSQTHEDFEFIVIDDSSTDETLSIIESYARKDSRVKVVSLPNNMGAAEARNTGLDLAKSEWVVCMDADDVMLPHRIERQVAFVKENPDLAAASTCYYFIDEYGKARGKYCGPLTSRGRVEELVRHNKIIPLHQPTVIMRKSAVREVGGYRQKFWPCEDIDLWSRIVERGYMVLNQPEYLLKYRKHGLSGSVSGARRMLLRAEFAEACMLSRRSGGPEPSWEDFLAARRRAPWWRRLDQERQGLSFALYNAAISHFSRRRYHLFLPYFLGATLLQPGFVLARLLSRTGIRKAS